MRRAYNIYINDQILLKGSNKKFMKFNLDVKIEFHSVVLVLSNYIYMTPEGELVSNDCLVYIATLC